jgi:hypothetical protein
MIRTIVYHGPPQQQVKLAGGDKSAADSAPQDGYLQKLVKYVPAEVLAVFVPLSAAAKDSHWLAWVVVAAGAVATVGYLMYHASALPKKKQPKPYMYIIALAAFFLWAGGTSETVRSLVNVSPVVAEVFLGLGALLMPLADWVCGQIADAISHQRHPKAAAVGH